jgi:hypothetical protein
MYNIVIGVIFIIGGLSGSLALRGTGSTIGLAVVGGAILLFGIIQVSQQRRAAPVLRPQPRRLGRSKSRLQKPPRPRP